MKKITILLSFLWMIAVIQVSSVQAHGSDLGVTIDGTSVTIQANFDDGSAMETAQIVVFSPQDPEEAWLSGLADSDGRFSFDIDPTIEGRWSVQARQAGHGEFAYLQVASDGTVTVDDGTRSGLRWLLASVVILSAVALIMAGKKGKQVSAEKEAYARS